MSNLTDLVPPLELCKKIPEGEFADSAFEWFSNYHFGGWHVEKRGVAEAFTDNGELYPAPTSDEILDKCKDISGVLNPTVWYQCGNWVADCAVDRSGKLSEEFMEDDDFKNLDIVTGKADSPVTAALKLWLELKGIEDGK